MGELDNIHEDLASHIREMAASLEFVATKRASNYHPNWHLLIHNLFLIELAWLRLEEGQWQSAKDTAHSIQW